jgi:CO/xanthine dehydrogenase Mo-binding subunit
LLAPARAGSFFVSLQKGLGLMSSVYRIPVGYFRGRGAVTNTVSTTPYRSAGRPEAIFVIERLVDLAADQLGLDPVALRRQNMIAPSAQPYANPLGITYDSGRYEDAMDTALALADWEGSRTGAPKRENAPSCAASVLPIMSRSHQARRASVPRSPFFRRAGSSW